MGDHRRIVLTMVLAFLSGSVLQASAEHDQSSSSQRSMGYTSRSTDDAKAWQVDVRARLFKLLKMDDLIPKRSSIPFSPKELLRANTKTYHVKEVEISSTSSRRIRIAVTIPNSIKGAVPAVVCVGGHGSNLYSPYDPQTIAGEGSRTKSDSIYKGFGTVLAAMGYVTISTTVSQHNVYKEGQFLLIQRSSFGQTQRHIM